jgi:hypothetical protein
MIRVSDKSAAVQQRTVARFYSDLKYTAPAQFERLLRPSALLDLVNLLKFTAISAMPLERKIRC